MTTAGTPQTPGEEIANTVIHVIGSHLGAAMIALLVWQAVHSGVDLGWKIVSGCVFGSCTLLLYVISSSYHAVINARAKQVLHVMDHMAIYFLIAGTYTPILLCSVRLVSPAWAWTLFGIVWGLAAMAATLTAIDLKKYNIFSMICYIFMGWSIIFFLPSTICALGYPAFYLVLIGGILYTLGAVLYGIGSKIHWMHSVFHIFVVLGSLFQFLAIIIYIL